LQPSVNSVAVSLLLPGLTVDTLNTFCGVFIVQCVKLKMIIFEFGLLLFDCFVYRQSVTCLKRFTRYGHYAGRHNHGQTSDDIRSYLQDQSGLIYKIRPNIRSKTI